MHPDGKRMLSGGHGREGDSTILRLWDVQAKRCIRSFVGHSIYADTVSFSAGCAVSQAWEEKNLRTWDLSTGTCRHTLEVELSVGKHAASNEEVFVPNMGVEDGGIDAINIHTGVIRSSPRYRWCMGHESVELNLCGNFLLAAVPHDADNYENEKAKKKAARKAGIYILDRSSLEVMNYVSGEYLCINGAANGDVVAEKVDGRFDVFRLDNHRLVFRTSFQRRLSQNDSSSTFFHPFLLVHNSRAYVNSYDESPAPCTEIYNIMTGDLERTLWHTPPRCRERAHSPHCFVAGKKELFCGFNSDSEISNALSAIRVYLLE
jgi:WD40 repeat protein